jgi:hypothetical protein
MKKLIVPNSTCVAFIGLAACSASAHAAITYIDAQEGSSGNTYATGGTLSDTSWIDSTTNAAGVDDASWMKRSGGSPGWTEHNGGDTIQGLVSSVPNLGEITTEIAGLADGTYNVWVFFWEQTSSGTQNWLIDAGATSGSTAAYSASIGPVAGTDSISAVAASSLTFSNAPSTLGAGGNQSMYGVNLGQVAVSGGSDINVYIDKLTGVGSNNRTIYDGVGYELAVPEPSSSLLVVLGALGLIRRRR